MTASMKIMHILLVCFEGFAFFLVTYFRVISYIGIRIQFKKANVNKVLKLLGILSIII